MASHNDISAQIKATIETVANRGPVHDYVRMGKNSGQLVSLFKNTATGRLNGWIFFSETTRSIEDGAGMDRRIDYWRLYGYMAIDDADASARLLRTQLESIRDAFLANRTLGGTVIDLKDMQEKNARLGLQIERVEPWMFAGVLCMRAQCLLITETEENF